ncbi:tachylectin-related carbohydrate-binding protein [Acrocarpospora sp. B8E8]|uniref:tachylectin-related carbohydrate-binding protein n=1 Tax=Acrocarpospora sp. B8E8 TaxID=3153572 RepID=UPI00325F2996
MSVQNRRKRRVRPNSSAPSATESGKQKIILWVCGAVLVPLLAGIPAFLQHSDAQAPAPELFQNQRKIVYTGKGTIFAVDRDGILRRFQHLGFETGEKRWSDPPGIEVGEGWQRFVWIIAGNPGTLYAVDFEGRMFLFDYLSGRMDAGDGRLIKIGLPSFKSFTGAYDVFYGLREDGGVCWYRHLGAGTWADNGACSLVKRGMRGYDRLIATGQGVVFAIDANGDLRWFRHLNSALGGYTWEGDGLGPNGQGWIGDLDVTSLDGVVYALTPGYALKWFRYDTPQVYKSGVEGWYNRGTMLLPAAGVSG